jgi:predicted phage terminase large subunit-like protein
LDLAPHSELLVSVLEQVERGEIKRLMVNMPPRHGKSLFCSELFPAWALGRNPRRLLVAASHSQELADAFGRRVRNLVRDTRFRAVFPACRLSDDSTAAHRFDTEAGGSYFGVGRGGGLTGRGGDIIVIDDPVKDTEEASSPLIRQSVKDWYSAVVRTRLQPDGRIVIVSTRWHLDDLSGWLLREHGDEGWKVINLPAFAESGDPLGRAEGDPLWPSHFPVEELEKYRRQLGPSLFLAMYQGRPVPEGGAIFRDEWLKGRFELATFGGPEMVIQSWDCAYGKSSSSGDYSACVTLAKKNDHFFVLNVAKGRWDFPTLKKKMEEFASVWNPYLVLVEDTASGACALQELRTGTTLPLKPVPATSDKRIRWEAVSSLFENGRVFFPTGAAWLEGTITELMTVPAAPYDDVTDALSQGLTFLRQGSGCWSSPGDFLKAFLELQEGSGRDSVSSLPPSAQSARQLVTTWFRDRLEPPWSELSREKIDEVQAVLEERLLNEVDQPFAEAGLTELRRVRIRLGLPVASAVPSATVTTIEPDGTRVTKGPGGESRLSTFGGPSVKLWKP